MLACCIPNSAFFLFITVFCCEFEQKLRHCRALYFRSKLSTYLKDFFSKLELFLNMPKRQSKVVRYRCLETCYGMRNSSPARKKHLRRQNFSAKLLQAHIRPQMLWKKSEKVQRTIESLAKKSVRVARHVGWFSNTPPAREKTPPPANTSQLSWCRPTFGSSCCEKRVMKNKEQWNNYQTDQCR